LTDDNNRDGTNKNGSVKNIFCMRGAGQEHAE